MIIIIITVITKYIGGDKTRILQDYHQYYYL